MAEQLLPAYNGRLDLRQAYTYTRDQINEFLLNVVSRPAYYAVPGNNTPDLISVYLEISQLRQSNGAHFLDPNLQPRQHVLRAMHPDWPPQGIPPRISKFVLMKSEHGEVAYWSLPDLLGFFLSQMGPAPLGATKRNFYLPLTAVFGQWCNKLCETRSPRVFQCTWRAVPDERQDFFLGATMGGHRAAPESTGRWIDVLNRARYNIIRSPMLELAGWSQARSLTTKPFGRCAETYPVRMILRFYSNPELVKGLALNCDYLPLPGYDDRQIWQSLWQPCANCKVLISVEGGNVANFAPMLD
ncbi:hypothetical protein BO99DRAFT_418914 [Aspergillus violaceofuscus CBS 115571]|uniref:Uncharacterized protein n=1 Tax=Aspergillus violaceofuscus (strain CBS 115571) TaxID=1450538 RepID=A0A2V5HH13_ASPV1|nr:hypothetical protein BO99DRAFT_418914 [Aspergillus violaceofuscus CBS 115571]